MIEYKTPEGQVQEARFDEIILAVGQSPYDRLVEQSLTVDADSALKLLGKTATWGERKVLGNVLYL